MPTLIDELNKADRFEFVKILCSAFGRMDLYDHQMRILADQAYILLEKQKVPLRSYEHLQLTLFLTLYRANGSESQYVHSPFWDKPIKNNLASIYADMTTKVLAQAKASGQSYSSERLDALLPMELFSGLQKSEQMTDIINKINSSDIKAFDEILGKLFNVKGVADKAFEMWKKLNFSFSSYEELHVTLLLSIFALSDSELKAMLAKNDRLGVRNFQRAEAPLAFNEQSNSGLRSLPENEIDEIEQLNKQYFDKFGFPFILVVKGYKKEEIFQKFRERIKSESDVEFTTALHQIGKLATFRLRDIFTETVELKNNSKPFSSKI